MSDGGDSPCTPHRLWEPPGIPLEMLDPCRGSGMWGSPAPGKKEGEPGERRGGRKCLFQCCLSKQSAPGSFASCVFALNSCFPTTDTDFGGPQAQSRCLELPAMPAGAGGRKAGCVPLPSFQWPQTPMCIHREAGQGNTTRSQPPVTPSGTPGLGQGSHRLQSPLAPQTYTKLHLSVYSYY